MRFAAWAGLFFALALFTTGVSRAQGDVVGLLGRMRDVSGPLWRAHLISVERVELEGALTVATSDSEGLRFTVKHCNSEVCTGTYFDGERLYSVNMNGTTVPQSAQTQAFLRGLRVVATMQFLSPSFLGDGGRIGSAGSATLQGRRYQTLVVGDSSSLPMRIYIDPRSALIRFARDLGNNDTFEYLDYRRAGPFMLPYEVLHNGKILERYDNRAAVSSAFHAPRGLVASLASTPDVVPTDPKSIDPIVDCDLAGVAVRCLIDTGNSGLSVSSELASRLGVPVVGPYEVRGLGGYTTQVVRAGPLHVGNATFPEAYYVVLKDLRRYGYDVVLGADVLASAPVVLDLSAHTIRFGARLDAGGVAVPLSFQNSVPIVPVGLGAVQTDLAVDTGDESNVNLAYDFYAKHHDLFTVTSRRFVSGIGGDSVELIGEIGDVTIGGYRTGPQRIGATWTLRGTASGHLGAAFLQQFLVELDYAAAQLRLIPRRA